MYLVHQSEYMGYAPAFYEFEGTWRELLEWLNGVTDENRGDDVISDYSDEELVRLFNDANGDGQPYTTVWDTEKKEKILG